MMYLADTAGLLGQRRSPRAALARTLRPWSTTSHSCPFCRRVLGRKVCCLLRKGEEREPNGRASALSGIPCRVQSPSLPDLVTVSVCVCAAWRSTCEKCAIGRGRDCSHRPPGRRYPSPPPPTRSSPLSSEAVTEWIEGDAAWAIIDRLATKYTGQPSPRGQQRVVAVIEPERQTVGVR